MRTPDEVWTAIERVQEHVGEGTAPRVRQVALDARALLWLQLAELAHQPDSGVHHAYAVACHYAALLDQEDAARVRHEHHIPTLYPGREAALLRLPEPTPEEYAATLRAWHAEHQDQATATEGPTT